jgi:hypothetical protein
MLCHRAIAVNQQFQALYVIYLFFNYPSLPLNLGTFINGFSRNTLSASLNIGLVWDRPNLHSNIYLVWIKLLR